MNGSAGAARSRRHLAAVALLVIGALTLLVVGASADAGVPITGTIGGSTVVNPPGTNGSPAGCTVDGPVYCTVTVYVRGEWNWDAHGSDCNTDRAGAGVGLVWNDPSEPGYGVKQGAISEKVGIASLRPGDTVNSVDEMVHPVDVGNLAEGYPGLGGQTFADPSPPNPSSYASWRGGCGRAPLSTASGKSATASPDSNSDAVHPLNPSGQTCADGTLGCNGNPWGSWGYELNGGLGYSHTYARLSDVTSVCVNLYDVHGGGTAGSSDFQIVVGANEVTVDANTDNSIQTNAFNPAAGAGCFTPPPPPPPQTSENSGGSTPSSSAGSSGPAASSSSSAASIPGTPSASSTSTTPQRTPAAAVKATLSIGERERIGSGRAYLPGPLSATVGATIRYKISVANTGNVALQIAVSDSNCERGTLAPRGIRTVAPGATATYTCRHVLLKKNMPRFTNTAIANGATATGVAVGPFSSHAIVSVRSRSVSVHRPQPRP